MRQVSRGIDRVAVTFDEPNLVANAGLVLVATLANGSGSSGSATPPSTCRDGSAGSGRGGRS